MSDMGIGIAVVVAVFLIWKIVQLIEREK